MWFDPQAALAEITGNPAPHKTRSEPAPRATRATHATPQAECGTHVAHVARVARPQPSKPKIALCCLEGAVVSTFADYDATDDPYDPRAWA